MNKTTKNFWAALAQPEPETPAIHWYLVYNEQGRPVEITSELPAGKYIEIDQETANRNPVMTRGWLVVDGELTYTPPNTEFVTTALRKHIPSKDIEFGDYNMLILRDANRNQ